MVDLQRLSDSTELGLHLKDASLEACSCEVETLRSDLSDDVILAAGPSIPFPTHVLVAYQT